MEKIKIEQVINELLMRSGSAARVQLESYFPEGRLVGGKYSMNQHTITMYIGVITEQCLQMFSSLDYMIDYFTVVFAHELGHAEDQDLSNLAEQLEICSTERERNMISLKIEENAWEFAERLLPEMDQAFMKKIVFYSLEPYREKIQMEIA
ncbi:hypothetical protein ACFOU2_08415 [Bacillus songklensis]|uniref:Phage protein n=1 Tax=Bacillus songklensis TaxID=1069116 RepID=A0ABV8AZU8_9BACI